MSLRHPAAQSERDANHGEIVARYQSQLCKVYDTSKVGGGFPDTVVRITTCGGHVLQLVEIKTADGSLSASQARFFDEWGVGQCVVVRTIADVDAHVERVRGRYR